ncbi:MAG TPA: hypothetical protein VER83_09145, partial [Candidatus Nanopelagicales bacterium]|nr:hypothetical protein [Candidatus Nanopelagicales bacterium]
MTIWKKAISVGTSAALLASLLITAIAPAALATTTTVVSAGSVPRGVTSTGTATFTLTEDTLDEWAQAGVPYTLLITVFDNAGNNTLTLSGGTLVAPGSLAISGFAVGGNTIALTVNDAESVAIEKIVISGVKIKASATSALGAMQAFVSGTLPGIFPATVTATGTLTLNANTGDTTVQVNSTGVCDFDVTGGLNGNLTFSSPAEAVAVSAVALFSGSTFNLTVAALGNNRLAGAAVTQTVANCDPGTLASPGTVVDSAILQYAPGSFAQPIRPGRNNED